MDYQIICGDALTELRKLEAESVQLCITSPPYLGLRDYDTGTWHGGDDPACRHLVKSLIGDPMLKSGLNGAGKGGKNDATQGNQQKTFAEHCPRCNATRTDQQIGLEASPAIYIAKMVEIFREVRRVLRPDGTLWLNLGDSYSGSGKGRDPDGYRQRIAGDGDNKGHRGSLMGQVPRTGTSDRPAKSLLGMPWRVAFALQDDGWILRQDIIWSKPACMPEAVKDRCTRSHEYVFMFAKSPRYVYDNDAIREPYAADSAARYKYAMIGVSPGARKPKGDISRREREKAVRPPNPLGRNKRSVWSIPSQPYREAHFATYPPALIEPMVRACSAYGDTVLDPFNGAGTTGVVALREGRKYVGIELNRDYCEMTERRISAKPLIPPDIYATAAASDSSEKDASD